ncbi:MAG: putative ribonucleoside-diphosphate reductase subunit beta [Prokaryotic dsDNA virus sp.]|nr:MAG: putative ribonucleoside-diphosphate reductase subunit beta [Prokaryotic dsDNA virus sp.]
MSDILGKRSFYKPFVYPEAFRFYEQQQQMHWLATDVPMHNDIKDLAKLSERDYNLVVNIQRFFTQSDVDVGEAYMQKYGPILAGHPEVRMMLAAFANMEAVHAHAYSLWLDTVGLPEKEYQAFAEYEEMAAKHDYVSRFNCENPQELVKGLAVYSAFTEGMQLFSAFVMLLHFSHNRQLLKGMGQIVAYSIRDESHHVAGMSWAFRQLVQERPELWGSDARETVYDICKTMVSLEDGFIDRAFELGDIAGLGREDVKRYIRYIADIRLKQLGLEPIYDIETNPLPWVEDALNSVELGNFFEQQVTEYASGVLPQNFEQAIFGG